MKQELKVRKVILWVGLVSLVGALATTWATRQQETANEINATKAVMDAADRLTSDMMETMNLYQIGLRSTRGAVLAAGEHGITRETFREYSVSRDLLTEFPGARAFGFIRRVPAAEEQRFLTQARADGAPSFQIRQIEPHEGDRYVLQYVEPAAANAPAFGLDLASEPGRRVAAERSMLEGVAIATGPLTLIQQTEDGQQSILVMMPVYRGGATPQTPAARDAAAFGWTFVPLSVGGILDHVDFDLRSLHVRITDVTEPENAFTFFESLKEDATQQVLYSQNIVREVYGRRWLIEIGAFPVFIQRLDQLPPRAVAIGGLLATLLTAALAGTLSAGRQRKELMLAERARIATIVENSSDAIVGEALDGRIISWNRAAEKLFGYSEAEALDRSLTKLLMPADRQSEEVDILARVASGQTIAPLDTQRLHRDGTIIDVSVTTGAIRDADERIVGAAKLIRDIRPRKEEERRLTDFNTRLEREVIERTAELGRVNVLLGDVLRAASEVAIIATDAHGTITIFNEGAERMLGYRADELVGKSSPAPLHVAEEVAKRGAELSRQYGKAIVGFRVFVHKPEADGAETREWTYVRKDGSKLQVSLMATAMRDAQGQVTGYLGIAEDITERRRATEALHEAKVAAEAANTAKGQFLTMMSHELRTPMFGVMGMADLLLTTDLQPEQRALLQTLTRSANTLLDLLNGILDFAKIEAGRVELEMIDFSPGQIAGDIALALSPMASEKGNIIDVDVARSLRPAYAGDAKRYRQILMNLAGNANKFTNNGRIRISIREVPSEKDGVTIETQVSDTGVGIAPEDRDRLFQPFIQADISTSRKFGGTGLGLAICKNLAELMGGKIWVESQPDHGSMFGFTVEMKSGDVTKVERFEMARPRLPTHLTDLPQPVRPLRVLLAEDNETNRMLLTALLSRMGHTVITVEHGAAAVEEAKRARYDVILMDMQMPVMDGPTAMGFIRDMETSGERIPIIAITADAMKEHHRIYREAGANSVVTKPVDWTLLAKEMERLTGGNATASQLSNRTNGADGGDGGLPVLDEPFLRAVADSVDRKLFSSLLDTFANNVRQYTAALVDAVRENDAAKAKANGHALKGLSGQFGARRLSELAHTIERTAKEKGDFAVLIPALETAAGDALAAVQSWHLSQRRTA